MRRLKSIQNRYPLHTTQRLIKVFEMARKNFILEQLLQGNEVQYRPSGQSMSGRIESKDLVVIAPVKDLESVKVGAIVYCKVRGNYMLHLVTAIDEKGRFRISNNHGHVNGWTKNIYGIVIAINPKKN